MGMGMGMGMKSVWQLRRAYFQGGPKRYKIAMSNGGHLNIDADEFGIFEIDENPQIPVAVFAKRLKSVE